MKPRRTEGLEAFLKAFLPAFDLGSLSPLGQFGPEGWDSVFVEPLVFNVSGFGPRAQGPWGPFLGNSGLESIGLGVSVKERIWGLGLLSVALCRVSAGESAIEILIVGYSRHRVPKQIRVHLFLIWQVLAGIHKRKTAGT